MLPRVQRVPIVEFVRIGLTLRYLRDVAPGTPIRGPGFVTGQISALLQQLEAAQLPVTHALAEPLAGMLAHFDGEPVANFLSDEQGGKIRNLAHTIEQTLLAEAGQREVFRAATTRYPTPDLLDGAHRFLAEGTSQLLAPLAWRDYAEAAKCLVVSRPTACAFHALRAAECELRELYLRVVHRRRIAQPRLWGPIIADLRKRRRRPPPELLDLLDHIRRSYRNPMQHPDAEYNLDQEQDLFGLCSDALNRMAHYGR